METFVAFAMVVFLLGLLLGLLLQKAYKRRRALMERDLNKPSAKQTDQTPLDKSSSAS
jgi:hypothetical protein